jgi:glutamine amidotransferase
MIVIIDYGMGNLRSVQNGFGEAGFATVISSDPAQIAAARGLILPGVGAFGQAMSNLRRSGLDKVIMECVRRRTPLLGICLGLQLLFDRSEEMGDFQGLGIIRGSVVLFRPGLKIPHVGWNQLEVRRSHPILNGVKSGDYFYFVHSFYAEPLDGEVILASTGYGVSFPAVIRKEHVFGIQFHPEKSSRLGLKILANFGRLVEC